MGRSYNYLLYIFYLVLLFLLIRDSFELFFGVSRVHGELGGVCWIVFERGKGGFPQLGQFLDLCRRVDVLR